MNLSSRSGTICESPAAARSCRSPAGQGRDLNARGKVLNVVVGGAVVGSAMEVVVVVVLIGVLLVLVLEAVEWLLSVVEVAVHAATMERKARHDPRADELPGNPFEGQGTGVFLGVPAAETGVAHSVPTYCSALSRPCFGVLPIRSSPRPGRRQRDPTAVTIHTLVRCCHP